MMRTTLGPDLRWPPGWLFIARIGTGRRWRGLFVLLLLLVVFPTLGLLLVFVTHGVSPIVANGSRRRQLFAPSDFNCGYGKVIC